MPLAAITRHTGDHKFYGTYPALIEICPAGCSIDNYPRWHGKEEDWRLASEVAFVHDPVAEERSYADGKHSQYDELMEVAKNKDPVCSLSSIQAVAHGADTVQYFQWRKGEEEQKFHGAVVGHVGHEHTRVFRDVTQVGRC